MKKNTLFWDVDTQFDFMDPDGKLYVPGAEGIINKINWTRSFALDNGYSILADVDWHSPDDPEISDTPDFEQTFPPHCMAYKSGADRIGHLGSLQIDYVSMEKMPTEELRKLVDKDQFHVVIRKRQLDVFENPNTAELIKLIAPKAIIVFGVALDLCVCCVLKGLAEFTDIKLCLLKDVTKGLGTVPDEEIFARFAKTRVEVTTLSNIRRRLTCGS